MNEKKEITKISSEISSDQIFISNEIANNVRVIISRLEILEKTFIEKKEKEQIKFENKNKEKQIYFTFETKAFSASNYISKNDDALEIASNATSTILRNISFKIDELNIISERMKRIKKSKKHAYIIAVENADNDDATYHATFNVYANFKTKSHRNSLSSEFRFYHELKNHFHAKDFRNVMRIEIETLKSRQI